MKKERISFHALSRSPSTGLNRIHVEKMRPGGRISTYMPSYSRLFPAVEMVLVFRENDLLALMLR